MRLFSHELLLNAGGGGKFDPITFNVGGSTTEWVVPSGIKQVRIECVASARPPNESGPSGAGGKVTCVLKTTPGQRFFITVANGDYNSSYISTTANDMSSRIVVAGGGGGNASSKALVQGGAGGGLTGATGAHQNASYYATGGSQTGAGVIVGGGNGVAGSFGYGGNINGINKGGDGWYGGASEGYRIQTFKFFVFAAGGGSSYTHPTLCSEVVHVQGFNADTTGWVTISMV